jgi:predicted TIM-barrel fold metal-dependent hydrolase
VFGLRHQSLLATRLRQREPSSVIIDAHVHLYPDAANQDPAEWARARHEPYWAALVTRRRKDGSAVQEFPSLAELVRDMDAAGIDQAVLLGWYWEHHATCVEQNRFYADCLKAEPARFKAFATVHAQAGEAALDEIRWARDAGFSGIGELSPHSQGVRLDDPAWRDILKLAGQLRLPVNLHVTDPNSKPYPGRRETPLADFVAMAREFPWTKFILAHWGGGLAFDTENHILPNVYYDTAASPLLYDADAWTKAPPGRVLFGSDYPLVLYPKQSGKAEFQGILREAQSAGAEPALFAANAEQLFP